MTQNNGKVSNSQTKEKKLAPCLDTGRSSGISDNNVENTRAIKHALVGPDDKL
jgi:hypothetical protein